MIPALLFALAPTAQAAACADDTIEELDRSMSAVLEAHKLVDEVDFERAETLMDAALTCLDETPPPSTLARLHHVMALRSFVAGQMRAAKRGLAALRLVDPRWEPPFPSGHPFTDMWESATDPGPVVEVGSIAPRVWVVDAVERDEVPMARSFLLQVRRDDGSIQLNRYLFDPEDMPDLGQNREVDLNETPWTLSLRVLAMGRRTGQRQRPEAGGSLAEQQASALGGGATVQGRFTPTAVLGGEVGLSVVPGDDIVGGGGTGVEGHGVAILGSGLASVGPSVLHAGGRLGVTTDTARAWPGTTSRVQPAAWQLFGPSLGAEIGLRDRNGGVTLVVDGALAGATVPWLVDASVAGTRLLNETVGLTAGGGLRSTSQPLADGEVVAGRAGATELRLTGGLDLVF